MANRLADRLHYLNTTVDKALETTRFWLDTRIRVNVQFYTDVREVLLKGLEV